MAQDWQAFPSAVSNGINRYTRTAVDPTETVGTPIDVPATDSSAENSMFALAKGMLRELGLATGTGSGAVNTKSRDFADPVLALGQPDDPPATDSVRAWSVISLLKGICAQAGL